MSKTNQDIVNSLYQFADILEASGNNPYKVRAFRRAAAAISHLEVEIALLLSQGIDLTSLPRIGKGISSIITHLIKTGEEPIVKESKEKSISDLHDISGLGNKRIKQLEEYNIHTRQQLLLAHQKNKLPDLPWLNKTLREKILIGKKITKPAKFIRLYHAIPIIKVLSDHFKGMSHIDWFAPCGEFRRKKETLEEIDFLIATSQFAKVKKDIIRLKEVKQIINQKSHHLLVKLSTGIQMHVHLIPVEEIAVALIFRTGNLNHIKKLKKEALKQGYQLKEKGIFSKNTPIAVDHEKAIYQSLGLEYIEPELREGNREIAAAKEHSLPQLITLNDIRGDLHSHTNETDGSEPLETMASAAMKKGYEYFAITDHSKHLRITNGLDEKRLLQQIEKIDQLNASLKNFLILKSIEVDILEDGTLDLANEVLQELDLVVASVHSKFNLPEQKQTARILKAMDNPFFNILGHATGRLIRSRPPYPVNMEQILKGAKEKGCFLELNSQPYRLDIHELYCQQAKELGVKIAISSDAHTIRGLNFMQLGVYQGRRGWLEKSDVINTCPWSELKKLLTRR